MNREEAKFCPLCQANNKCGVNDKEPCWCMKEKIPTELIEKVPSLARNKACICQACVEKYHFKNIKEVT